MFWRSAHDDSLDAEASVGQMEVVLGAKRDPAPLGHSPVNDALIEVAVGRKTSRDMRCGALNYLAL